MTGWDDAPVTATSKSGGAAGDVALSEAPDAPTLLRELQAHSTETPLRFLADQVERLSPAALQTLIAAMREADTAGRTAVVVSPSFAFSLAFESFGFGADNEPFTVEYA
jgi:anti-anti-sigma regulatory factor